MQTICIFKNWCKCHGSFENTFLAFFSAKVLITSPYFTFYASLDSTFISIYYTILTAGCTQKFLIRLNLLKDLSPYAAVTGIVSKIPRQMRIFGQRSSRLNSCIWFSRSSGSNFSFPKLAECTKGKCRMIRKLSMCTFILLGPSIFRAWERCTSCTPSRRPWLHDTRTVNLALVQCECHTVKQAVIARTISINQNQM